MLARTREGGERPTPVEAAPVATGRASRREALRATTGAVAAGLAASTAQPSLADEDAVPTAPFDVVLTVRTGEQEEAAAAGQEVRIKVHPDWSPRGAQRFRELVQAGFYDDCRFFRVLPGFVAQVRGGTKAGERERERGEEGGRGKAAPPRQATR